jgi:hypothetical protein
LSFTNDTLLLEGTDDGVNNDNNDGDDTDDVEEDDV